MSRGWIVTDVGLCLGQSQATANNAPPWHCDTPKNDEGGKLCNRLMTPLFYFCKGPLHLCNRQMTPLLLICNPPFCSLFSNLEAKAKHIETANCNCVTVHKRPQSKSSQCPRKGEYTPKLHCHLSPEVKYMETVITERQWLNHISIVNVLPRAETHLWWTLVPPVPALSALALARASKNSAGWCEAHNCTQNTDIDSKNLQPAKVTHCHCCGSPPVRQRLGSHRQ